MNIPTSSAAAATTTASKLSSLSEWSVQHIKDVFESGSDEDSLRSVGETFADDVTATMNGAPLPREGIDELVLSMRRSSKTGLLVEWRQTVEVPRDPETNRDGSLSGYYVIRGLRKRLPGMDEEAEFERHKTVIVSIESQLPNTDVDSRRIVNLAFQASDVKVDHCQDEEKETAAHPENENPAVIS